MRRTGGAALLSACMALLLGAPASAQEEPAGLADLFCYYTKDNVICEYYDDNYLLADKKLQYKAYDGFLSVAETDLDQDGTQELLAIRLKPQQDEDGRTAEAVIAEVYRRSDNTLQRTAQYTLSEGMLNFCEAQINVFPLNTQDGTLICCESRSIASLVSDGMAWSLRAAAFNGTDFAETVNLSFGGSSFEDVDFTLIEDTMNRLGLTATNPTLEMLTDGNDWIGLYCTVRRYFTADMDTLNNFLFYDGNGQEQIQYGETWFKNYVNMDRENKISKEFAVDITDRGGASAAGTASASRYSYAQDYVIADSDSRYITQEELQGLSADEILLARNEIYARRGRIFNDPDLDAYFRSKSWYQPSVSGSDFTEEYAARVFNDYEMKNIATMIAYERAHGFVE